MSQSIRNYNPDTEDLSWNIRDYDSVRDDFTQPEFYEEQENFDVKVAERDGEIMGYVAYGQEDGHGILDLIEVMPKFKGTRDGDRTVSKDLAEHAFEELERNNSAVMIQAKALQGPVQSIAESHDYEVSGFQVESNIDIDEYESGFEGNVDWKDGGYSAGGFTAEMWKLDEDLRPFTVDTYLSPEVKETAEASMPEQMELEYLRPGAEGTGDFNYTGRVGIGPDSVEAEIERGEKTSEYIVDELTTMAEGDNISWIHSVDLDVSDPLTYGISEGLAENDWSLINVSPNMVTGGAVATMAKPNKNAGSYNFTPKTMEFVEATDLPFRIDMEGEKSDAITFNPESGPVVDPDTAADEEIDEFYQEIVVSD